MQLLYVLLAFSLVGATPAKAVYYSFEDDKAETMYSKKEVSKIVQESLKRQRINSKQEKMREKIRHGIGYALIGVYVILEGLKYFLDDSEKQEVLERLKLKDYKHLASNNNPLWYHIPKMSNFLGEFVGKGSAPHRLLGMWVVIEGINCLVGNNGLFTFKIINGLIIQPIKRAS